VSLSQVAGAARWPRLTRVLRAWADEWNRLGEQMIFYAKTLGGTVQAVTRYKTETMRLLAQMSLGVGALAAIGGAMGIVPFLVMNSGAVVALVGEQALRQVGVEALGGFFSAFVDTRFATAFIATTALSATIGAGATAQLGAMRINEEIDALEVMGVPSITYLASTRVVAGMIAVVPIYFCGLLAAYAMGEGIIVGFYGESGGAYEHYFNTFLEPRDALWSTLQVAAGGIIIMLIHTYYGLTASGGPAGVGVATGRAVRASLVVAVFNVLIMSMALYGRSGNFHLSA
jgi:phospholipid/cholesterol/gamma-HCH transport system permease protein